MGYKMCDIKAALPGAAIPAGWKLVPIEPTIEMLDSTDAIVTHYDDFGSAFYMSWGEAKGAYQAMLNAAPESGDGS